MAAHIFAPSHQTRAFSAGHNLPLDLGKIHQVILLWIRVRFALHCGMLRTFR
jgi:hypothetical protein